MQTRFLKPYEIFDIFFTWGILLCLLNISDKLFSILAIGFRDVLSFIYTAKPVQSSHSKIDKTKFLMTNGSLMLKVESIAECSPWSILQYFRPALSDYRS